MQNFLFKPVLVAENIIMFADTRGKYLEVRIAGEKSKIFIRRIYVPADMDYKTRLVDAIEIRDRYLAELHNKPEDQLDEETKRWLQREKQRIADEHITKRKAREARTEAILATLRPVIESVRQRYGRHNDYAYDNVYGQRATIIFPI